MSQQSPICSRCACVILSDPTEVRIVRPGKPEHRQQSARLCRSCDEALARTLAAPPELATLIKV